MLIGHIDAREIHLLPRSSVRWLDGRSAAMKFLSQSQSDAAAIRDLSSFLDERNVDGASAAGPASVADRIADLIANGEALVGTGEPQLLWRHAVSSQDRSSTLFFLRRFRMSLDAMWNLRHFVLNRTASFDLSRVDDDRILEQVASLVATGEAVVGFRVLLRGGGSAVEEAPARPKPAAPVPRARRTEREGEPDPPTFVPDHEAAAQAQALIAAARNGTPFCEECEKARMRRALAELAPDPATFETHHDAAMQAQALVAAAQEGFPFCEQCEKAKAQS